MRRFPRPANLNWTGFNTFGYPWHGKWQQERQANGQWKDALTLITEAGEDAPETPAPVFDDGSTIPKLSSGTHLIDVQMPWAKEDVPENTPAVIAQLGGKYWNRALYAPDTGMLYGKSLRWPHDSGDGAPPNGRVDFLYGDPEGVVWGFALFIDGNPAQSWVPGKGEPGALKLMARRVAGRLLQSDIPGKQPPDFSSHWITIPLTGAQSLSEVFPAMDVEASGCFRSLSTSTPLVQIYTVLHTGELSGYPIRPHLKFLDAVPDGNRAMYGVTVSYEGVKNQPSYLPFAGFFTAIVGILEVSLSGSPHVDAYGNVSGVTATVTKSRSPSDLLYGEFNSTSESPPDSWAGGGVFVYRSRNGQSCFCTVCAGYRDGQVATKALKIESSYGYTLTITSVVTDVSPSNGNILAHDIVSREIADASLTLSIGEEDVLSFSAISDATAEGHLAGYLAGNGWAKGSSSCSSQMGGTFAGVEFSYSSQSEAPTSDAYVIISAGRTSTLMEPVARADNFGSSEYTYTNGIISYSEPLLNAPRRAHQLSCYVGSVSPQVVQVSLLELSGVYDSSTPRPNIWYRSKVITLGDAKSDEVVNVGSVLVQKYISWCPIRDQLLVTDRPSSWV